MNYDDLPIETWVTPQWLRSHSVKNMLKSTGNLQFDVEFTTVYPPFTL